MANSTKSIRKRKVEKPTPDFPLTPHPSGRWCKRILKRLHYFGKIDDPDAALEKFHREWPYLKVGKRPPAFDTEGEFCTIEELANQFLTMKENRLDTGELSSHTFAKYYETCELLIGHFGPDRRVDDLRPDEFESFRKALAQGCNVVTLKSKINRCRVVLKYAYDQRLVDRPVEFGQSFDRPSEKMLRKARNEAGERMFEADEIRRVLDALDGKPVPTGETSDDGTPETVKLKPAPVMRAMVLLGVNGGLGNTDVATLPQSAVDFENGRCVYPRPKTSVRRRIPLWPETIDALRKAIAVRPAAKDSADSGLCFITSRGTRYVRVQKSQTTEGRHVTINALSRRFEGLLKKLKINGRRGLGFYALRHVAETIGGECRDQVAVDAIMGHVDGSMAGQYRERISDERLQAVTETIRAWLWPADQKADDEQQTGDDEQADQQTDSK